MCTAREAAGYGHIYKEEEVLEMARLQRGVEAPNFVLDDFNGNKIELNSYRDKKNVLLVFNRGFA